MSSVTDIPGVVLKILLRTQEWEVRRVHRSSWRRWNSLYEKSNVAFAGITCAAVCVYPARVSDAVNTLKAAGCNIPVASGKLYSKIAH